MCESGEVGRVGLGEQFPVKTRFAQQDATASTSESTMRERLEDWIQRSARSVLMFASTLARSTIPAYLAAIRPDLSMRYVTGSALTE